MNYKYYSILLVITFLSCFSNIKSDNLADRNLVIPGKSAEGYIIGSLFDCEDYNLYSSNNSIGGITGINLLDTIKFNSIVCINDSTFMFLNNRIIIAIAGLNTEKRITSEAVDLSRGLENFIFNYGNNDLKTFTSGKHKAYIYKKIGIAVFNDNSDDTIDMFLVF